MIRTIVQSTLIAFALASPTAFSQAIDTQATETIRSATTDERFLTDWVAILPENTTVPSPRDVLGYTVGTPGKLTHVDDIHRYFRALAAASPRVHFLSLGTSQEGREMMLAVIADANSLEKLDEYKRITNRLADPRGLNEDDAEHLIDRGKPIYWITAGLHSPELGPPETTMELAYRLAVDERSIFDTIRKNVITLITPVLETDGRARQVEWYYRHIDQYDQYYDTPPKSPPFWGHYTFHDNNRDGLTFSQPLTRNYVNGFYDWKPTLSLDMHESVPLLYVSTGTGPYNNSIDPITVTEWQSIANFEVSRLTGKGLPGVWTWGFYTGWFPGYLLWVTNNHNANGRFYETFGNHTAQTVERDITRSELAGAKITEKTWYRADPPQRKFMWSMRNNINFMQSAAISSLEMVARNPRMFLENFYRKSVNGLDRAIKKAPYAFAISREQRDNDAANDLVKILQGHAVEIRVAANQFELKKDKKISKGDLLIKLNQPYGSLAQNLLEKQEFPEDVQVPPYDDVAWTLGLQMGVEIIPVADKAVLELDTKPLPDAVIFRQDAIKGSGRYLIVDHQAQNELGPFRFALGATSVSAADADFELGKTAFNAGSLIIDSESGDRKAIEQLLEKHGLTAHAIRKGPKVAQHDLDLPRVAIYQSWGSTQNSGWVRYTLDQSAIPYELISKDRVRRGTLADDFDLIVVPALRGGAKLKNFINGIDKKWSPLAYTKTAATPSHGLIDSSEDITGGLGFEGMAEFEQFVSGGGTVVTLHSAGVLMSESGIASDITTSRPSELNTPGSILTTKILQQHPLTRGYDDWSHVFRGNGPLYQVNDQNRHLAVIQFGSKKVPEPFEKEEDNEETKKKDKQPELVRSGAILNGKKAIDGAPALLHQRVGKGNVVIFAWNPLHRHINHHDHAYFYNALLNWNDLPEPVKAN